VRLFLASTRRSQPSVNLAQWKSGGPGGDIFAPTAPQDTSAALLSQSALAPSSPFYDPNPPVLSLGQLAIMYGMTPQQVAAIQGQATRQAIIQVGSRDLIGPATDLALPELGVSRIAAQTITKAIDTANHISEPFDKQYIEGAPDRALFKRLNDSQIQSLPSAARRWLP